MQHAIPELDRAGLRKFGLTMGAIIAILFGVLIPWLLSKSTPTWVWALAGFFVLWAFIAPDSLKGFYKLWMKLGLFMSKIMNPLVLGIVFFLVFMPMGLVMRAIGRQDPMCRKIDKQAASYRKPSQEINQRSIERPF